MGQASPLTSSKMQSIESNDIVSEGAPDKEVNDEYLSKSNDPIEEEEKDRKLSSSSISVASLDQIELQGLKG